MPVPSSEAIDLLRIARRTKAVEQLRLQRELGASARAIHALGERRLHAVWGLPMRRYEVLAQLLHHHSEKERLFCDAIQLLGEASALTIGALASCRASWRALVGERQLVLDRAALLQRSLDEERDRILASAADRVTHEALGRLVAAIRAHDVQVRDELEPAVEPFLGRPSGVYERSDVRAAARPRAVGDDDE